MNDQLTTLRINEIFYSIQGEGDTVGFPTVFVRLTGCPLRCGYCDTSYAFTAGKKMAIQEILNKVAEYHAEYVTVTGGEPLAQAACISLLTSLCNAGYKVSLETSGALDIARVDPRVMKVLDFKTPGSGEVKKNLYGNIQYLKPTDQIKFVICDLHDYEWAKNLIVEYRLDKYCLILFSPSYQQLAAATLAEWILSDKLKVRFQVQLHKLLWGDIPGR